MKVKILGNVKYNGTLLVEGDIVDMSDEKTAKHLIESDTAEKATGKVTKDEPKSRMKSLRKEVLKLKTAKTTKKGKK